MALRTVSKKGKMFLKGSRQINVEVTFHFICIHYKNVFSKVKDKQNWCNLNTLLNLLSDQLKKVI